MSGLRDGVGNVAMSTATDEKYLARYRRNEELRSTYGDLAATVQIVREGRGLSLREAARDAEIGVTTWWQIEHGTDPTVGTLTKMAMALRLPVWSLLGHACGQPDRAAPSDGQLAPSATGIAPHREPGA